MRKLTNAEVETVSGAGGDVNVLNILNDNHIKVGDVLSNLVNGNSILNDNNILNDLVDLLSSS